jgi:cell division protein FtsL
VTDDNIKMQLLTYSTQITEHSNDRILKKINAVFKYDAGGHQRQRRVVPVIAIAGFFIVSVLIMSTAYVLYETKKELHAVEQNLNEVSLELAKLTRIVNVDKYIANFKFNLNSYIATTESLIIDFLQHLSTGETILLESLPATILNQFKNFNVKAV